MALTSNLSAQSTSSTLIELVRYPAEQREYVPMEGDPGVAYFRDVLTWRHVFEADS